MAGVQAQNFRFFRPSPTQLIAELRGLAGLTYESLEEHLNALYARQCCAAPALVSGDPEAEMVSGLMNLVRDVWQEKGIPAGTINKQVTTSFARKLLGGMKTGYSAESPGVVASFSAGNLDFTTPDWNTLAALQRNIWHFSAAKNYSQLRSLSNALIGTDGKLRTFRSFQDEAAKINDKYVKQWLQAEYELAVAGSQMAGKWTNIEENEGTFPLLQFDAVNDDRTTELCRSLDGTIRPVHDPFWSTYYPPNHFGCRSTVRQLTGGKVTPHNQLPSADIPDMFQTNLGQDKLLFPATHPYYQELPDNIRLGGSGALRKEMQAAGKARLAGKSVETEAIGEVQFTSDGIKEMFNQPHDQYDLKNQLAVVADQMLKNAHLLRTVEDPSGRAKAYHYLSVKGLGNNFILVVREMIDGRKVLYSIVDKMK